jgi:hypothetical protein
MNRRQRRRRSQQLARKFAHDYRCPDCSADVGLADTVDPDMVMVSAHPMRKRARIGAAAVAVNRGAAVVAPTFGRSRRCGCCVRSLSGSPSPARVSTHPVCFRSTGFGP